MFSNSFLERSINSVLSLISFFSNSIATQGKVKSKISLRVLFTSFTLLEVTANEALSFNSLK